MALIGSNRTPRAVISEPAKKLVCSGELIESYVQFATQQLPFVELFHEAHVLTAIGHACRDTKIPMAETRGVRQFFLIVAPSRTGKGASVKIAKKNVLAPLAVQEIVSGSMEGVAQSLARGTRPVLIFDEIGYFLEREYSRQIAALIIKAYDGDQWEHITRQQPFIVSRENMRVSVTAMSTPDKILAALTSSEISSGFLPRFIVINLKLSREQKRQQRRMLAEFFSAEPVFREAVEWIRMNAPESVVFQDSNVREHFFAVLDEIEDDTADLDNTVQEAYAAANEHIISIAATKALSELRDFITEEDIDYALDFYKKTSLAAREFIAEAVNMPRTYEDKISMVADKILLYVSTRGGLVAKRDVMNALRRFRPLVNKAEKILQEQEKLAIVKQFTGNARKPKTLYCTRMPDGCEDCNFRKYCSYAITRI